MSSNYGDENIRAGVKPALFTIIKNHIFHFLKPFLSFHLNSEKKPDTATIMV